MALVAAQIGQLCAERLAPGDGAAIVAGVTGKSRIAHFRQHVTHHVGIAAKTVAGQDQHVARQVFELAIRALVAYSPHLGRVGLIVDPELTHQRVADDRYLRAGRRLLQSCHQAHARFFRYRVHALRAVAGVEKAVEQHQRYAVARLQRVDGRRDRLRVGGHQMARGSGMRFGLDVGSEALGTVGHAGCALHLGAGGGNETR